MPLVKDKLWNWGHLEGSHNKCTGLNCKMTPEEFAEEYGIKNAFIVSYGGNIQPPFGEMAKRFTSLREIKWSVLGDASTPLPEAELGCTEDVCIAAKGASNITGGIVDDFFSPKRTERFTPKVLKRMKDTLNGDGLDFWCVLYKGDLEKCIDEHLECFDGVTFWLWESESIKEIDDIIPRVKEKVKGKRLMLGIYLWDYARSQEMPEDLFKAQTDRYFKMLMAGEIDGIVFCSSTVGDAPLAANRILKAQIQKYGDIKIN
jgi:hypothetical protein